MRISVMGLGLVVVVAGVFAVWQSVAVAQPAAVLRTVVVNDGSRRRVVKTGERTVGELLASLDAELSIGDKVAPELEAELVGNFSYLNIFRARPVAILEWADARTANLYGVSGQPFRPQLYDVVPGEAAQPAEVAQKPSSPPPAKPPATTTPPTANLTELKVQWMTAAGIPEADWDYVDFIVFKESSWNPNAVNRSSGACGLAQALPCSKVPGNPFDPVVSLTWQKNYVTGRYGGYKQAYEFWRKRGWY